MARAILRRPDLLLVHRGLMQLDPGGQDAIIGRIVAESRGVDGRPGFGILWNLESEGLAQHFDRVVRMENGRVVEDTAQADETGSDRGRDDPVEREPMRASA